MLTRKLRRVLARIYRDNPKKVRVAGVHHAINERAAYRARLAEVAVDGQYGLVRSGMDCDCTSYHDVTLEQVPVSMVAFVRDEDHHREWLDGPESTYFVSPVGLIPMHESRDLAAEAFEDGHPHSIAWAA